ncbi:MAG: VWA domain-containing protein, partial [Chloroflexi bacterium]|nr:VWA domain-containing protein [Chloroflexota bacterium]
MTLRYRYSQWDDTQVQQLPDPEELLEALSEDFLHHGDLGRALRQLMQRGYSPSSGQRQQGIQDLLRRLRQQRQETLARHNLDSLHQGLKERVEDIVRQEREAIQSRLSEMEGEPPEAGDAALRDVFKRLAQKNLATLDA